MENTLYKSESLYSEVVLAPTEIGTCNEDVAASPGKQERVDSCAIHAQQHVLYMFGIDIPESSLIKDALLHGEYAILRESGTVLNDVGNLLERNGIETNRYLNATIANLISELAQGHKVIVGVDSGEFSALGNKFQQVVERHKDILVLQPDHAVVVVSVDAQTFDVDIVDPADGKLHRLPAEIFLDAWEDSGNFMVATAQSPAEYLQAQNVNHQSTKMEECNMPRVDNFNTEPQFDEFGNLIEATHANNEQQFDEFGNLIETTANPSKINDIQAFDLDGDGVIDGIGIIVDQNGNGIPDGYAIDTKGTGQADLFITDSNEDGHMDIYGTDTTGDGKADVIAQDINGDGVPDVYSVDTNNDGVPDSIGVDYNGDGFIDESAIIT